MLKTYPEVPPEPSWVTITSEDFEGPFPGEWQVYDNDPGNGISHWGNRSCRPFEGGSSGWAVGGGDGSSLSCGSDYPNYVSSWMVYGPFSLVDASDAEFSMKLWLNVEDTYDYFFCGASIDGDNYYGLYTTGNSAGWVDRELDLTNVDTLGNLTGQPSVWIALFFGSDSSSSRPEGAYVDDILLRKYTGTMAAPRVERVQVEPPELRERAAMLTLDRGAAACRV